MKCRYCGCENLPGNRFCTACRNPFPDSDGQSDSSLEASCLPQKEKGKLKGRVMAAGILLAVLVALLSVTAMIFLGGRGKSSDIDASGLAANTKEEVAADQDPAEKNPTEDITEERSQPAESRETMQVTEEAENAPQADWNIYTDKDAEPAVNESAELYPEGEMPFYGIWCAAFKDRADAQGYADELVTQGFGAQVYLTSEWTNLSSEEWYVVTAGIFVTEEEAEAALPKVQAAIKEDAYIKYSGERQ